MDPLRPQVDRHVVQQADRCFSVEATSHCYRKDYGDGNRSMIKIRCSSALDVSHAPFHLRIQANLKPIRRRPGSVMRLDAPSSYDHSDRTRCGNLSVGLRNQPFERLEYCLTTLETHNVPLWQLSRTSDVNLEHLFRP